MKSRVLVVGGSGYMGRRLVKASLALGHPTFILQRPDMELDIEKIQILLGFKQQGAHFVEGSFSDHWSLVDAVKLVDVVICAISGVHHRSHSILLQLKLVDAIKEAAVFVDEDDIATYTIKTIDDPRSLNKTIYLRPPENIMSQRELVEKWEKLIGKQLEKVNISADEFLSGMKDARKAVQAGMGHFYHIFYEGCMTNFEIGDGEDASKLYHDVKYTRVEDYLKRYL